MNFLQHLHDVFAHIFEQFGSLHSRLAALENHPAITGTATTAPSTPPAVVAATPAPAPAAPHVKTNLEYYGSVQTCQYLQLDPNAPFVDKPADPVPPAAQTASNDMRDNIGHGYYTDELPAGLHVTVKPEDAGRTFVLYCSNANPGTYLLKVGPLDLGQHEGDFGHPVVFGTDLPVGEHPVTTGGVRYCVQLQNP